MGCCQFQRYRVRCIDETGGEAWSGESFTRELKLEAVKLIKNLKRVRESFIDIPSLDLGSGPAIP